MATVVSIKLIINYLRGYNMKLHIGVNTFDLAEHDGDDLYRLTQALVADLQHYSNMNMDDEHDQTQIALDELLEYLCFDRS